MQSINTKNLYDICLSLKDRDEKAIKDFFLLMQPQIFYFLYRYTSVKEVAEDLTQETFVNFLCSVENLNPEKSCVSYLYKIARNLAMNHLNKKAQITSFNEEDTILNLSNNIIGEIEASFLLDDYQKAINALPERCKATFLLSRFSGFDYSEIAEIMDVSVQTVKNQMNKALAVLRKRLVKYLE